MFTSHEEEERRKANPWIGRVETFAWCVIGAALAGAMFFFAFAIAGAFGKVSP